MLSQFIGKIREGNLLLLLFFFFKKKGALGFRNLKAGENQVKMEVG